MENISNGKLKIENGKLRKHFVLDFYIVFSSLIVIS